MPWVRRGSMPEPRPWENLLLPADLLQPREGRYLLKLTEPMEEAAYLDSARLAAYDLPPGWQMVLDERMGISGPEPTGEPRFYRRELSPVRAHNERGQTVTTAIAGCRRAGRPAGPTGCTLYRAARRGTQPHPDFFGTPGRSAGHAPAGCGWLGGVPLLADQLCGLAGGRGFQAPTLEAMGRDGRWRTLLPNFGYPAGMPRRMSVPLQDLPPGTRRLRLRTNQQIYWDRVAVAFAESPPAVRRHRFPLRHARVAKSGFPKRTTHAQHRPDYDYAARSPFWDARYMAGFYTALGGGVDALVSETDDAVAIIGSGEEIHLEFAAGADPLPPGWTRRFVLETNGWTKDMDLFTRDGENLEPIPSNGRPSAPVARLHARFNRRYQDGR